jgi:hypothetical protein
MVNRCNVSLVIPMAADFYSRFDAWTKRNVRWPGMDPGGNELGEWLRVIHELPGNLSRSEASSVFLQDFTSRIPGWSRIEVSQIHLACVYEARETIFCATRSQFSKSSCARTTGMVGFLEAFRLPAIHSNFPTLSASVNLTPLIINQIRNRLRT